MQGRVALLGDSAHAMQPNLGQGGCMAIEDGYVLAAALDVHKDESSGVLVDIEEILKVQAALLSFCIEAIKILTDLACFHCAQSAVLQIESVS